MITAIDGRDPVLHRQSGGDEHSEHAGVDRIPNIGVGAHGDQFVIFDQPRTQGPLLAERADSGFQSARLIRPQAKR